MSGLRNTRFSPDEKGIPPKRPHCTLNRNTVTPYTGGLNLHTHRQSCLTHMGGNEEGWVVEVFIHYFYLLRHPGVNSSDEVQKLQLEI